jgi:hypothetical protein
MCLILILANAAQTGAQVPSDRQAYCVDSNADFYPYTAARGYPDEERLAERPPQKVDRDR